jgi:hypothetical protein
MSVKVSSAVSNTLGPSARNVVRTSGGTLYAIFQNTTNTAVVAFKSTDGTTWTEQNSAGRPATASGTPGSVSAAIDSTGVIHVSWWVGGTGLKYVTFDTSTDTWGTAVTALALTRTITNVYEATAIAIDSSNKPHIAFVYNETNMSIAWDGVYYTNKVGAGWKAQVQIEGATAQKNCGMPDITISDENVPEISYINVTSVQVTAAQGNANDAASFTLFDVETTAKTALDNTATSIAIDSAGATYVAWISSVDDLKIRKCPDGNSWTTGWDATTTLDSANNLKTPSLAIDGTDRYVFAVDTGNNDLYYYKNSDARVLVETGTFTWPKAKWAFNNNNQGSTQIDYVFQNGSDIYWNKLTLVTGTSYTQTLSDTVTLTDSLIRNPGKVLVETITHTDTFARLGTFLRSFTETLTHTDTIQKQSQKSLLETVTLTATFIGQLIFTKLFSETVTLTDSLIKQGQKVLSDTLSLTDSILKSISKTLAEVTTYTDTFIKQARKTFAETVTHTDTLIRQAGKNLSETIAHSDTFTKAANFFRSYTESISLTDTLLRFLSRSFSETVTLTGSVIKQLSRSLNETVNLTDTVLKTAGKTLSETLTYTDSLIKQAGKYLSENLSLTDTIATAVTSSHNFIKSLTETVSLTDSLTKTIIRVFSETITYTDSLIRQTLKSLSDTLSLTDALERLQGRTFSESFSLTDTVSRLTSKVFTETVTLTDRLKQYLNGILVFYYDKYVNQATSYLSKFSSPGTSFSDKYSARSDSYSDKYSGRGSSFSDKYSTRSSSYDDKFTPPDL